ncbi:insulin receptor substrate 1-B [Hippocampus zosterae]|uniref:insulin receptor substrate 1-B n=1 Tax=Hippocampus zosterae TaxID=109293 RepID=UPI00223D0264|nr:insulin receptor substrate 1-B [Hippocampus zosterae]
MSSDNSPRGHDASPGPGAPAAGDAMDGQSAAERGEDVRKSGYLRKHKSMHRRYFVLRSGTERGAARLEYYESEKKFRGKAPVPKKAVLLETCFNINKRADSKNKHMIVLYTRAESFAVAADNQVDQDDWYQAMVDLQCKSKNPSDKGAAGDYGVPNPGPAFKEVWQVKVWPKGLGQAKNLVGIYRLCLTDKTINFVKLNSDAAAVVLQLMNVRRCGHSENFFFVEVGRSAVTGPGEFWMQVDDSVVAQNMHETLLEAMKALSEEFRQRSKSQSNCGPGGGATASNPISVPTRRHHSNPPPSQVGFARRPRTEPPGGANGAAGASASPTPRHGFPRSRAASDGGKNEEGPAGLAGSSPSANGSCSGTPVLRSKPTRQSSVPTAKTPLGLMRSMSTPAASPGPSPSSSSGHGSEFGSVASCPGPGPGAGTAPYGRCVSVSGSPSDYGSSDEYGSSPGEQTLLVSPGSAGGRSLGEDGGHYILMGQHGAGRPSGVTSGSLPAAVCGSQAQTRRVLRRSSSRECEAERSLLSKRASLPPMALERLLPCQPPEEDSADYAVMSRSASRESFSSASSATQREAPAGAGSAEGGGAYFDLAGEFRGQAGSSGAGDLPLDNGYMSMLPGVTRPPAPSSPSPAISVPDSDPKPPDDYMAMTPNSSVSPPRRIRPAPPSDGYMIMSPGSSCSPDQRGGLASGAWVGGGADGRAGGDYMNMSPISARSVNGSPPPSGRGRSESAAQQPLPKMVYSYYSLPRSYKHNPPSRRFDDGAGRGRRPHGTPGGHPERTAGGGGGASAPGRLLSLSSSSYSSSSASSESLGESEERAPKDASELQRRRGSGGAPKRAVRSPSRPVSLFVDVSKANTLPRVRENPLPPEPKSPGEYVSIQFEGEGGDAAGARGRGLGHPPRRPASCLGAFAAGSRGCSGAAAPPAASEYVNMDLGPSPSPSPSPSPNTPLVFPPFHSPPTPPTLPPASRVAENGAGGPRQEPALRKIRETVPESRCPASCGDYTVMAFKLNADAGAGSSSPEAPSPNRTELSAAVRGLDFPLAKSGPNPDHGAKVIRADPQGRRRHCSESFLASSSLSATAPSSAAAEQAGPHRPAFESAARRNCAVSDAPAQSAPPGQRSAAPPPAAEQGLNYIDLDLANKESPHLGPDAPAGSQPSGRLFSAPAVVGDGAAGVNSYASIDFCKSEELRTHPDEGTEC